MNHEEWKVSLKTIGKCNIRLTGFRTCKLKCHLDSVKNVDERRKTENEIIKYLIYLQ